MLRRLFALLFALSLALSVASAEDLTTYQTEHFSFSAPSDWLVSQDGNTIYLYGESIGSLSGGMLYFSDKVHDIGVLSLDEFYNSLSGGILDNDSVSFHRSSDVSVGDFQARLLSVNQPISGTSNRVCYVLCYHDGCLASFGYSNPSLADDEVDNLALSVAQSLVFKAADPLFDIANDAFGDNLISAKRVDSSGYIFVDVDLHGTKASSMISNLEDEATDFLAALRNLVDSGAIDFTEVSFNGYTDLIDVYGNTSHDNVIQFWITRETLDKINFDRFIPSNMEAIATNWYLHPAMSK